MTAVMLIVAVLAVAVVVYMLIKKADIKLTLFGVGFLLLVIALIMGKEILEDTQTWVVPFQVIVDEFKRTLGRAGFIILVLGGYTRYMSHIGANEVTVATLTKPLKHIKSPYILVPVVFLLGNLLSLVIPSASNLSIILLATLYPVLKSAGMTTLTAAGVIATTATVMPTPLGGDNVAIAAELAQYPEFAGLTATEYVLKYHAIISIPTLILMAVVHYFWQKYKDKQMIKAGVIQPELEVDESKAVKVEGSGLFKTVYTLLPILPIVLLIIIYIIDINTEANVMLGVELAVFICFFVAIICELFRKRDGKQVMKDAGVFFQGMAGSFDIVVLLVAASVFVAGLKGIGLISFLETTMQNSSSSGIILPLIMVLLTALIVILSGSGTALFYSMVPLMYSLAAAAGISAVMISIPMGLAGNLLRAVSPVSAVVMIVAGSTKQSPIEIVKRTSVPMIVGVVFMFIMSMILL